MRLMLVSWGRIALRLCRAAGRCRPGAGNDPGRLRPWPTGPPIPLGTFARAAMKDYNSLWRHDRENFFADPRAKKIGDVLTVVIQIDDRASLDNTSERGRVLRSASAATYSPAGSGDSTSGGEAELNGNSGSSSAGSGSIDRSEEIVLSVAAVVTDRLPNGNLVISGSQEVRVNYEMRILQIAGIVDRETSRATTPFPTTRSRKPGFPTAAAAGSRRSSSRAGASRSTTSSPRSRLGKADLPCPTVLCPMKAGNRQDAKSNFLGCAYPDQFDWRWGRCRTCLPSCPT
jgi:flagellar L-ring protein precursor FlgH